MELARIKLDDQLLLDGLVHVVASGLRGDFRGHVVFVKAEPGNDRPLLAGVESVLDPGDLVALVLDRDHVADANGVRGDVDEPAVDGDVPVGDELAGVTARGGKPDPVDHVVQPRLQETEQVETGHAGHLGGPIEVEPELALEQEVDAARALLGSQLDPVVGHLAAADLGVHAGRHRATVEGALREALLPLQKELDALPAAVPANRTFVAGHLDASPLRWPAAVVRDGRDVGDRGDLETGRLQGADGGLAAGSRALDEDLDLLKAMFHGATRRRFGGDLRGKGGALARSLEALAAGTPPGEHVALGVGQRHDGVVEGRLDVRLAHDDVLLLAAAGADDFFLGHLLLCLSLLAHADRLTRATAGARVGPGALSAHGQAAPVAQPAIGPDLHQALDVERDLAAQLAFDLGFLVEDVAEAADLLVVEVLDAQVGIDVRDRQHATRRMRADSEDIGEGDLDALLPGNVNAGNSCHLPSYPCLWLCLGVTQMTRTAPPRLMTLHFAHIFFTDARTFISHSAFRTIRPRPGSSFDTSTRTRSPGITRRNRSRAAGATCATILWPV